MSWPSLVQEPQHLTSCTCATIAIGQAPKDIPVTNIPVPYTLLSPMQLEFREVESTTLY